jgi:hypothetical protein
MGLSWWIFKRDISSSWNFRPNRKRVIGTVIYGGILKNNICKKFSIIKFFKFI